MKHKLSIFFLSVAIVSSAIWIGAYLSRQLVFYYFFSDELGQQLKPHLLNGETAHAVLISLTPLLATTLVSFVIYVVSSTFYFLTTSLSFKLNGWLFIILSLFAIQVCVESYFLFRFDYDIFNLIYSQSFSASEILSQIIKRGKSISSFPIINLLISISIYLLLIFKPMKKNES